METNQLTDDVDEATAVRITSWVLGEASPSEVEQLEALCEAQPRWRDYEKKLRSIHFLLQRDAKDTPDDHSWKMSAEKRDVVFATISQANSSEKGKGMTSWRLLARVACLVILASLAAVYIKYSSDDAHRHVAQSASLQVLEEDSFVADVMKNGKSVKGEADEQGIAGEMNSQFRSPDSINTLGEGYSYGADEIQPEIAQFEASEEISSIRSAAAYQGSDSSPRWSSTKTSDTSFQKAFAAFQNGKRLPPQDIRVEDFYNAFDYGDPAPSAGEPIAFFSEQAFNPLQPQRLWLRISTQIASTGRDAMQPLYLTFLIDSSAKMASKEQRQMLTSAMSEFGKLLTEQDRVSVVGFAASARLLGENIAGSAVKRWQPLVVTSSADQESNLVQALALGESVAKRHKVSAAQNRIIFFLSNSGHENQDALLARAKSLRQQGYHLDIVAIGEVEKQQQRYAELTSYGNGRFFQLNIASEANDLFAKQWAGPSRMAAENVKTQIRFHQARVTSCKLEGWQQEQRKMQSIAKDFVDTSDISFGAVGNSFYEISPRVDGSGEIGEVIVSYRNPTNGKTEQRKWIIPWQSSPPAFVGASPSMQLGGLSVMVGNQFQSNSSNLMPSSNDLQKVMKTLHDNFALQDSTQKLLEMTPVEGK
jgi:von Willebrand factor type A domain